MTEDKQLHGCNWADSGKVRYRKTVCPLGTWHLKVCLTGFSAPSSHILVLLRLHYWAIFKTFVTIWSSFLISQIPRTPVHLKMYALDNFRSQCVFVFIFKEVPYICIWKGCACARIYMQRSEENLWASVLSSRGPWGLSTGHKAWRYLSLPNHRTCWLWFVFE